MDQEDWKAKYKELSTDFDDLQSQLGDRSMDQLVCQMAIALEGRSELLDKALATLCDQLKNDSGQGAQNADHQDTLKLVEKQLRSLDLDQERSSGDLLQALHKWIRQLRLQLTTDLSQDRINKAEAALVSLNSNAEVLPGIVNDLVSLQTPLLTADKAAAPVLPEAVSEPDLCADDNDILLQKIGAELLILLSGLHIPKDEMASARRLAAKVEKGFSLGGLAEIISDVVALVARLSSYNSADFENYLVNLTGQLAEVQAYLVESQKVEQAGGKAAQLSSVIHKDVQAIHLAVKSSNDLHELKSEISSQLINIVKSVDSYKRKEEAREQQLQDRYQQMNERLEEMELQTQTMKVHIEDERIKAMTDPLTSLPNRAAYDEQIAAEFERWKRYQQHFSIAIADIDLFKRINDSYGHQAGDKVLRLIGNLLTRNCRTTDFVARYGGEEFVILLPSTSADKAAQGADKIRQGIETSPFNFHGKPVQITMSFGVAEVRPDESVEELFERADKALYSAKNSGRNRIELG